jgi:antiphage defense system Thoeris ThsB-like protein
MASNVFVSFDHDDQRQVGGFRLLKNHPNHPLDFQDHSLKDAVRDRSGQPIKFPPSDPRSKPVRDVIVQKFDRASKLVVLVGDNTHNSAWVDWEINTFFAMKHGISAEMTWRRIRGMTLKGSEQAIIPNALYNGRSTQWLAWDPEALNRWLDQNPDA